MNERTLAGGWLVDVDDRGKAALKRCPWLVEVKTASLMPAEAEWYPDSPSDVFTIVECEARMKRGNYGDDTIVCEHGHEFGGMERRLAPGGPEWRHEQEERFNETGSYR